MLWLWLVLFFLLAAFSFVLRFGAPYLPTLNKQAGKALDLLNLKPGQTLYDLGCGDGQLLRLAARRGINSVGYELNPVMFAVCWLMCCRRRRLIRVKFGNFWQSDISRADGVFVFLLGKFMPRLDKFMKSQNFAHPVPLVSYAFKIPGKKPIQKSGALFLYRY